MSKYDLSNAKNEAANRLQGAIERIVLKRDWQTFSAAARKVCDDFLILAASNLLAEMRIDFFFHQLCRSADNWHRFLVSSRDHYYEQISLTYNAPLLAAIIADDDALLGRIHADLPKQSKSDEEYEDHFIMSRLLIQLAHSRCECNEFIIEELHVFEQIAHDNFRYVLFASLLGLNGLGETEFWEAFEDALYANEEHLALRMQSVATNMDQFIAHKHLWFEGLAWLRLAQVKEFTLPSDRIDYCPEEALKPITSAFQNDWPLVPLPA